VLDELLKTYRDWIIGLNRDLRVLSGEEFGHCKSELSKAVHGQLLGWGTHHSGDLRSHVVRM
jgi:hypothetical protein